MQNKFQFGSMMMMMMMMMMVVVWRLICCSWILMKVIMLTLQGLDFIISWSRTLISVFILTFVDHNLNVLQFSFFQIPDKFEMCKIVPKNYFGLNLIQFNLLWNPVWSGNNIKWFVFFQRQLHVCFCFPGSENDTIS